MHRTLFDQPSQLPSLHHLQYSTYASFLIFSSLNNNSFLIFSRLNISKHSPSSPVPHHHQATYHSTPSATTPVKARNNTSGPSISFDLISRLASPGPTTPRAKTFVRWSHLSAVMASHGQASRQKPYARPARKSLQHHLRHRNVRTSSAFPFNKWQFHFFAAPQQSFDFQQESWAPILYMIVFIAAEPDTPSPDPHLACSSVAYFYRRRRFF